MSISDLVGQRTTLVPMRLDESDLLARWASDPSQRVWWFGRDAQRQDVLGRWSPLYFDDAYPLKGRAFRVDAEHQAVGAAIHGAVWGQPSRVLAELLLAPGTPAELGSDALRAMLGYLFDALRVREVWAEVPEGDARALAAFEGAGFARSGRTAETGRAVLRVARPSGPDDGSRRRPATKKPK